MKQRGCLRLTFSICIVLVPMMVCEFAVAAIPLPAGDGEPLDYASLESVLLDARVDSPFDLSAEGWSRNMGGVPNVGFTSGSLWLRFNVSNPEREAADRWLQVSNPLLSRVELFHLQDDRPIKKLVIGNSLDFDERPISHRSLIFPLSFPPQSETTIYLRVESGNSIQVPIRFWTETKFWEQDQYDQSVLYAYYGLLIAMICYNLIIAWGIRDRAYYYYVGTIFGVLALQSILHGSAFQFIWPHWPQWNAISMAVFIPIANGFSSLFSNKMLRLKEIVPWLHMLIVVQIVSAPVLVLASVIFPYQFIIPISAFFVVVSASIIGYAGIRHWRQYETDARIFTVAWNVFVIGCIGMTLSKFGVLSHNWWTQNLMQIGSALETILLSFALASRINRLREDSLRLERDQLQARENEIKAERALLKAKYESKAKSDFLAVMSHEIRTPMNGVLGVLDLLKDTRLTEAQLSLVGTIESSGNLLLNIINDILDLSKVEAGKLQLEVIPLSLQKIVNDALQIHSPAARQKNLVIGAYTCPNIKTPLLGDPTRLKQVVFNLVGNAIKFTESGHVFIGVTLKEESDSQQLVRLEVRDSGIGLDDAAKRRLFSNYAQAESSTSRRFGGTGLGLAISRKLVEAMGGSMGVDSEVGEGSTFWAELPLDLAAEQTTAPKPDTSITVWLDVDYLPLRQFIAECLCHLGVTIVDVAGKSDSRLLPVSTAHVDIVWRRAECHSSALPFNLNSFMGWEDSSGALCFDSDEVNRQWQKWPIKVLVVEDNPVNQIVITKLLTPLVLGQDLAVNGRDALQQVCQVGVHYDYIFMDCEMPDMGGYEVTRRIRDYEKSHNLPPVRIIAVTAHAFGEFESAALESGMNGVLTKPVVRADFGTLFAEDFESGRVVPDIKLIV